MSLHSQHKWIIGLTGSILSGKSTALVYFKQAGAEVISCDEIVQDLYRCPGVLKQIKAVFATSDKRTLSRLVFNQVAKRKQLEQILHPWVLKKVRARIKQSVHEMVVVEVPLLFEAGWDKWMDLTVCVLADDKNLSARLKGRKMSRAEYERRLETQLSPLTKASRADVVFRHTNKAQLQKSVTRFCNIFKVIQKTQ